MLIDCNKLHIYCPHIRFSSGNLYGKCAQVRFKDYMYVIIVFSGRSMKISMTGINLLISHSRKQIPVFPHLLKHTVAPDAGRSYKSMHRFSGNTSKHGTNEGTSEE